MAEKIPDTAVLSFWSILGNAIPLSSHAVESQFLNIKLMHIFQREVTFVVASPSHVTTYRD